MASKQVELTLVKSLIGRHPRHILTAKSLGLTKRLRTVRVPDNAVNRGKLAQIGYLLEIQEVVS